MSHIKIKIDNTTLPTMAEYSTVTATEIVLQKLAGTNGAVLRIPPYTNLWMSDDDFFKLERTAEKEYNNNSNAGLTSRDLLMAIAIANHPELSVKLLKD
jgi:hypothetical protein